MNKLIQYKTTVSIPIYDEELTIVFTNDLTKTLKKYDEKPLDASGVILDKNDSLIIIFPIDLFNYQTAVHESYHAMRSILDSRDVDDEESEAYLLDFIFGVVEKQYLKIKTKFK